ncbi:MAG: hypothetical protein EKK57_10045 [Proteobacteria bacterium]|nr:MAG: hypothetical protein EKK57_10045 [Pseudomonadota bacterium]
MRYFVFVLFLLCSLCKVQASILESGAYVTGLVGYGYVGNNSYQKPTNNNSYSIGATTGYSFNQYLALDGNVTFMPNNNGYSQFSNYFLSSVAGRFSVPFSDFFSGYLHVGPGLLTNSSTGSNQFGAFLGLGGIFKINNQIGISVEDYGIWLPNDVANDINIFAVGVTYGF